MQSITKHGTDHCLDDGEIHHLIEQQLWPLADMPTLTTTPSLAAAALVFKQHRLLRLLPDSHAKSLLKMLRTMKKSARQPLDECLQTFHAYGRKFAGSM
jgi:hypothetical protein